MSEQTPYRRSSLSPLVSVKEGARGAQCSKQKFNALSVNSAALPTSGLLCGRQDQQTMPSRKGSMPVMSNELRNLVYSRTSTASLSGMMGMMASTAFVNQNNQQSAGVSNFAEILTQQLSCKPLNETSSNVERVDSRLGKLRRQTEKRSSNEILHANGKSIPSLTAFSSGYVEHFSCTDINAIGGTFTIMTATPLLKPSTRHRRASFSLFSSNARDSEVNEERLDKLKERLSLFEIQGLPRSGFILQEFDFHIESSWEEVVCESQKMCKESRLQQAAIWELLQTEVNFIGLLRALIEVYIPCIEELQRCDGLLENVECNRLMGNVNEIFMSACTLWTDNLQPCLKRARESGQLLDPRDFRNGFIYFHEIMHPYAQFTIFRADAKTYHESLLKDELFGEFVKWAQSYTCVHCEWLPKCADVNLESLLSQPWQRLQRYPLILKEIRRYSLDEEENNDISLMIEAVELFCATVDRAVSSKDHQDELLRIQNRLEEIRISDLLDSPSDECQRIIHEYMNFDLFRPMEHCQRLRCKLHQSQLRMRDDKNKWIDVISFLFTDMILLTRCSKRGADRLKQIRAPVRLDKLVLRRLTEPCHGTVSANQGGGSCLAMVLNDFGTVSAVYIFSAEAKLLDDWSDKVCQAQEQFKTDLVDYATLSAEDSLFLASKPPSTASAATAPSQSAGFSAAMHRTQSEGLNFSQIVRVGDTRKRSRTIGSSSDGSEVDLHQLNTNASQLVPLSLNHRNISSSSLRSKTINNDCNNVCDKINMLPPPSISVEASLNVNDAVSHSVTTLQRLEFKIGHSTVVPMENVDEALTRRRHSYNCSSKIIPQAPSSKTMPLQCQVNSDPEDSIFLTPSNELEQPSASLFHSDRVMEAMEGKNLKHFKLLLYQHCNDEDTIV